MGRAQAEEEGGKQGAAAADETPFVEPEEEWEDVQPAAAPADEEDEEEACPDELELELEAPEPAGATPRSLSRRLCSPWPTPLQASARSRR